MLIAELKNERKIKILVRGSGLGFRKKYLIDLLKFLRVVGNATFDIS